MMPATIPIAAVSLPKTPLLGMIPDTMSVESMTSRTLAPRPGPS